MPRIEATAPHAGDRIPTEFCYWNNLPKRSAQGLRTVMRALFGADRQLPDEVVRAFAHSYYDADPIAEAFVEDVYLPRGQAEDASSSIKRSHAESTPSLTRPLHCAVSVWLNDRIPDCSPEMESIDPVAP